MVEYKVTISKIEATIEEPREMWCASVNLREPGDTSFGLCGHSSIGQTPQEALASLAVYWASQGGGNG